MMQPMNSSCLLLVFCDQINFFQDHSKVILCPLMGAVTFIDDARESRTFRLSLVGEFGCGKALWSRLRYAQAMVRQMLNAKSSTESARPPQTVVSTDQQAQCQPNC